MVIIVDTESTEELIIIDPRDRPLRRPRKKIMPEQISVQDFLARRNANPKSIVIDVRDDEKWKEGHIPGAKHIHKTKIEEEIKSEVPDKNTEIFCHCGGGTSGPKAAEKLSEMGYKNVHAIHGGFRSYKASGEKIV